MPARAALRLARLSGHAFETIGRERLRPSGGAEATRRHRAARLRAACAQLCDVHGFELELEGALPPAPCLLVSNHVSYVDAPVLGSLGPCTVVAKGEVQRWPLIGSSAEALGVLFVRRGDVSSGARVLRTALRALGAGVSVLAFPEGTTSDGRRVLPFRRGLFGVARIAQVPVVPLAIRYAADELRWVGEEWFLPHYLRTAMRARSIVRVRVGPPLSPRSPSAEALAQAARAQVRGLLESMEAVR
jgi:1-acyl-sn-glycerol-3-phosphate acyltransferase